MPVGILFFLFFHGERAEIFGPVESHGWLPIWSLHRRLPLASDIVREDALRPDHQLQDRCLQNRCRGRGAGAALRSRKDGLAQTFGSALSPSGWNM